MLNINEIKFAGHIGSDIEVKYLTNGDAVCTFSVAHNHSRKDSNGEWQQETTWLSVKTFRYLAEKVGRYGVKGGEVYISGRFRTRTYQDRNGQDRTANEIVANDVQFPGSAKDGEQPPRPAQSGQNSYAAAKSGSARPNMAGKGDAWEAGAQDPDFEDSIPF